MLFPQKSVMLYITDHDRRIRLGCMFNIGFEELILILLVAFVIVGPKDLIVVLALVLFGGGKLAGVGKALGQSIREFKKEVKTDDKDGEAAASETNEAEKK